MFFQLPFFEYKGFLAGTVGSKISTVCMGLFIVIWLFIEALEKRKIAGKQLKVIILISFDCMLLCSVATILFATIYDVFKDYFFQPFEIHLILMTLGWIYFTFLFFIPEGFLGKNSSNIIKLSEYTLVIYMLHLLICSIWKNSHVFSVLSENNILILNLINWLIICIICFVITGILKKLIPDSICEYFI